MNNRHYTAFLEFHQRNPDVYRQLERLAFKLKNQGHSRWGIKALWEVLRYEMAMRTTAPVQTFALNNNFTAFYARLLMENNPDDLADFFETRERHQPAAYR